jgi:transposase
LAVIERDNAQAKDMISLPRGQIAQLNEKIHDVDAKIAVASKSNELCQHPATVPGVGTLRAITLAAELDPTVYESGRHLAAWLGSTQRRPIAKVRQRSTQDQRGR